ncbi:MAG: ECF transporter S component [Eubacteriales bacterium]|nr:ECF transporter S component [Eubacteriales bacterium]
MESIKKRKPDTKQLARASVLCALIVVMTVVPYTGYIYYGLIEVTTLHIVVAAGAVLMGWKYGAVFGFVWGVTCILRALTNPLWAPFINPMISLVPRVIVGAVAGLAAEGLRKARCKPYATAAISAAAATLTNTVLVLSALKLFSAVLTGAPLLGTIYATLIGVNGVIELVAAIILVPVIVAALTPRTLTLGVDIGASTTKLALVERGKCVKTVRKQDDETLEAAIDRIGGRGAKKLCVTGVGASFIKENLCGIPTAHVDEFAALSRGATACAHKHNCVVVSVGTGTSFTRVTPLRSWHLGGSGMGGGMVQGLAGTLCGTVDMEALQALAKDGDLHAVDLQLQDVCQGSLSHLGPEATVSNLCKLTADTKREDMAAGLCNMVFQNIAVMAAFAVQKHMTRTVVLVGTITDWPIAKRSLDDVAALRKVKFIIPEHSAFVTAIGAALEQ